MHFLINQEIIESVSWPKTNNNFVVKQSHSGFDALLAVLTLARVSPANKKQNQNNV